MSDELDPNALMYRDNYNGEQISEIVVRVGGQAVRRIGDDARIYNSNEFSRVMYESGLSRTDTLSDYNRTSGKGLTISPESRCQRTQHESASEADKAFTELGIDCDTPFSADMSALLMIPRTVPDDFGDAGTATV